MSLFFRGGNAAPIYRTHGGSKANAAGRVHPGGTWKMLSIPPAPEFACRICTLNSMTTAD